jgi:hypothetical protein
LRFKQIGHAIGSSELSSISPLAKSRQHSSGDISLDSASYDGSAIATCCTPAGFMLLEGSNTEPFGNNRGGFGPVVVVEMVDTPDEAIAAANRTTAPHGSTAIPRDERLRFNDDQCTD